MMAKAEHTDRGLDMSIFMSILEAVLDRKQAIFRYLSDE